LLTLGIRPEHLRLTVPAPKHLAVTVQRAEALGSETYLTVSLDETISDQTVNDQTAREESPVTLPDSKTMLVRLNGTEEKPFRPGDQLTLGIRVEHIHLFAPETGETIIQDSHALKVEV
jgi:multiple sugar transport system ATP-binding protein